MKLTAPPPVREGDAVAVVSPSFGAVGRWPHRAEQGRAYLESLGLRVKQMPNAARDDGWASASGSERADDLHTAFADPEVSVVLASIGGLHSNGMLPHIDWELIAAHPKVFQGYSDITVLHWAMATHAGLSTFYGPTLVSTLGEYPQVIGHTDRWMRAAWMGSEPLDFDSPAEWADERLDWNTQADRERPRETHECGGWVTLRPGRAEGWLFGGCLESIAWHLKGSAQWPDLSGALLFLETGDDGDHPADADSFLTDLEQLGVFEQVNGLIVGRPSRLSHDEYMAFHQIFLAHTESAGIPVLADFDIGHTDPMVTLPLGVHTELDAWAKRVRVARR